MIIAFAIWLKASGAFAGLVMHKFIARNGFLGQVRRTHKRHVVSGILWWQCFKVLELLRLSINIWAPNLDYSVVECLQGFVKMSTGSAVVLRWSCIVRDVEWFMVRYSRLLFTPAAGTRWQYFQAGDFSDCGVSLKQVKVVCFWFLVKLRHSLYSMYSIVTVLICGVVYGKCCFFNVWSNLDGVNVSTTSCGTEVLYSRELKLPWPLSILSNN